MAFIVTDLVECLTDSASMGMNLLATLTVVYGARHAASASTALHDHGSATSTRPGSDGSTRGGSHDADGNSIGSSGGGSGAASWIQAVALPVFGSFVLLAYRYFFRYFEMFLMIGLTIMAGSSFFSVAHPPFRWIERRCFGSHHTHGSLLSFVGTFVATVFVVARWLTTAHWAYTDALAMSTAVALIDSVRLPSARSATFLLVGFLLYDAFWVLILPFFVHDNVMADVAWQHATNPLSWLLHTTGFRLNLPPVSVPITLHVPSVELTHATAVLGLADIVLPALFAVYCLRCDAVLSRLHPPSPGPAPAAASRAIRARVYHLWHRLFPRAIVGYAAGLFAAMYASALFRAAQPVLLFVVPPMVLLPAMLARNQGQWGVFWNGALLHLALLHDSATLTDVTFNLSSQK
ncbi:hypothetical protein PTSG_01188 [Salpingoeca rosetta]|uniref:Uncharacterized protein n=1 Tax=Salpingoeca rosetta (strain ATCC 50818 / BSB-021) TaxID=946362 RepID=F2U125_SALR5|nr:uncharacterized protein PTSG_01188 [Salpingoeca rosetta]EGD80599.1 hypothetical protein PTSG_01188 [Salpingoeca rosetta]|eukprot:XP_004997160.1 hypothetical protein PTSG_01188 [Salpingoeca rosetta]